MLISLVLSLLFFGWATRLKNSNNTFLKFLVIVYLGSFLTSIYMSQYEDNIEIIPTLYLVSILIIFFFSFKSLGQNDITSFRYGLKTLKFLGTIFNIILIPSFIYFSYSSFITFTQTDISSVRLSGDYSGFKQNFFTPLFSNFSALFFFPLFLYFLSLKDGWKTKQRSLFFISSFSFVALTLSYAGRDGVIYWLLNFIVLYMIFEKSLPIEIKNQLKKRFLIGISIFIPIFIFISIQRFITSGLSNNIIYSLSDYYGQQLGNFSDAFDFSGTTKSTLFPGIVKKLFNLRKTEDTKWLLLRMGFGNEINNFGYFIKNFIWAHGKFGTLLISLIFFFVVKFLNKTFHQSNNVFTFLIIFMFYQIPLQGVFYYRQLVGGQDLPFAMFLTICLISSFTQRLRIK